MSILKPGGTKKPVIFISHVNAEVEVALAVKKLLEDHLLDAAEIFVSEVSIGKGAKWASSIYQNIKLAVAEIILCSPTSCESHWVLFEAGAGWMRNIPVIPVFFAGMTDRNQPDPLKNFQGVNAANLAEVTSLVQQVAKAANCPVPAINCAEFIAKIQEINARRVMGPPFPTFFETSADIQAELPNLIRAATHSILLCGIHFNISLANRIADYFNAMKSGVALTFCCMKPESPDIEQIARFSGEKYEDLKSECQLTYTYFDRLKREHIKLAASGQAKPGKLSLRFATFPPSARAYIFDHTQTNGKLIYIPYLHLLESTQCPTLLIHSHHTVYRAFLSSCLYQANSPDIYYESPES